jgi:hypothetical protein
MSKDPGSACSCKEMNSFSRVFISFEGSFLKVIPTVATILA